MLAKFSCIVFLILCWVSFCSQQPSPQTTKIKAVVFDFGGVLAKTRREEVEAFIVKSLNVTPKNAVEILAELKEKTAQGGDEEDFWTAYAKGLGKQLPKNWLEQLDEVRFQALKMIPGTVTLVQELQRLGFQTALLSNVKKRRASIKSRLGYYELFDPALFSYEIGVNKPDAKAYSILLEKLNMPAEAVLFIDNKLPNVEAARALGIDAILFKNAGQLVEEFKQRGIQIHCPPL